tara:strand:+ start:591 stop:1568 length:978 start_codon:yes stop_codon:yes gene_type:complete
MKKKIKIFLTIGPSSLNKKFLTFAEKKKNLISLVRINLSHVGYKNLRNQINFIKKYCSIPICIDTEGAQIRSKVRKKVNIKKNKIFFLYKRRNNFNLYPENVFKQVKKNDKLSIGFEGLVAKVISKNDTYAKLKTISSGILENNKGVHLENRNIKLNYITKKDLDCISLAQRYKINNFALSFTNSISDITKFQKLLPYQKKIFKIESSQAIKNIKLFFLKEKNFLIDRGDLSKSIGIENIPIAQRKILNQAKRRKNIQIAIATNFLESMITRPFPTRAEVNDIYNALELGADNLVLAAETAIGKYPKECIIFLEKIINTFKKFKG